MDPLLTWVWSSTGTNNHTKKNFKMKCRVGGKPSTWFPPAIRRADHLISNVIIFFFQGAVLTYIFPASGALLENYHENLNFFIIFQHFNEEVAISALRVTCWSCTRMATSGEPSTWFLLG